MEKEFYIISKEDLHKLLEAEAILNALEAGGVDNWNYYGEAINDALNGTGYETVSDFVDGELMSEYTLVENN